MEVIRIGNATRQKVHAVTEAGFADEDFELPQLCRDTGMRCTRLFRKMRAIVNVSPSDFIRSYRMQKARMLLQTTKLNVSEVAWQVGYKDPSHFSKSYQEAFGSQPNATKE